MYTARKPIKLVGRPGGLPEEELARRLARGLAGGELAADERRRELLANSVEETVLPDRTLTRALGLTRNPDCRFPQYDSKLACTSSCSLTLALTLTLTLAPTLTLTLIGTVRVRTYMHENL